MKKVEKVMEQHCRYYCDHCKKLLKDDADVEMSYPPKSIQFSIPKFYFKNPDWSTNEKFYAEDSFPTEFLIFCPECEKEFKNKIINESEIFKNNLEKFCKEFLIS